MTCLLVLSLSIFIIISFFVVLFLRKIENEPKRMCYERFSYFFLIVKPLRVRMACSGSIYKYHNTLILRIGSCNSRSDTFLSTDPIVDFPEEYKDTLFYEYWRDRPILSIKTSILHPKYKEFIVFVSVTVILKLDFQTENS